MQYWNEIIHTAMLGTDKKPLESTALPASLQEVAAKLPGNDAEENFLQTAALAYNFRQCSTTAIPAPEAVITAAEEEVLPCCSKESMALLTTILHTESSSLLLLWLQACQQHRQIVQPDVIPQLLEVAIKQKQLRTLISACCGNRGMWLGWFNTAWNFGSTATPEEIWQTGTLQQRVQVLAQLRQEEPATALQWLQATWPQETAATKEELLAILENNTRAADLSFLESLASEKGKKAKDAATALLKLIPESGIVQAYWQVLQEAIYLKKEKALLGLTTKTKLVVQLPEKVDESIYKSGIDKLSANAKNISDEDFIMYQLTGQVPPHFWEQHLNESIENILSLFQKNEHTKQLIPALGLAAARFKNLSWLKAVIAVSNNQLYPDALKLFPDTERDAYALQSMRQSDEMAEGVMHYLMLWPGTAEWSIPLTQEAFSRMVKNPWRYHRDFFNHHIHLVPSAFAGQLEKYLPKDDYQRSSWQNTTAHIAHLLQLKQQISTAFS